MASNYAAIKAENERRYGTDIGRIGLWLLANRYDDRTHFIFELLQNAEDALKLRHAWNGSRAVRFDLVGEQLRVSHFGKPFDENDVRGICGILLSTKNLTDIGRFGIGFKSVYAVTEQPEVHSGKEDFVIENFVWPVAAPAIDRKADETVIQIPSKPSDPAGPAEIAAGLGRLGASTLLFLREIEEVNWSVEGGRSGLYLRDSGSIDTGVRRVTLIGQEQGGAEVDEIWLVFSRPVTMDAGRIVGNVEIAFSLAKDAEPGREAVRRVDRSPLVVFFPTVLETYLGFLVQGPYRTTPSRDNVPRGDPWNQQLVGETASLLVDALRWMRDRDFLDTRALQCLPLDPTKFGESNMFVPLFAAAKQALSCEPLLPRSDNGYVSAEHARLGRTQELRDLFTPSQLAALLGHDHELHWLSGDITPDRAPELRRYLMQELNIAEVTPETIVPYLDKAFLQEQPDVWILGLYHFLNGQMALRPRLKDLPLIRLEDGTHVPARVNGQPQAFLPGKITTGFPTVRASVCATEIAREFLRSLGLTEPDPVDDVVRNVLPKYKKGKIAIADPEYAADIGRILAAFSTDSKGQRDKLLEALRGTPFVWTTDAGDGPKGLSKPGEAYLATERLKELFAGVTGVRLVDDSYSCLRGEDVRELLEACGATRYLQPVQAASTFNWQERRELRVAMGYENMSWEMPIEDVTLRGLSGLLDLFPQLDGDSRRRKAVLLWEALGELADRRGAGVFSGTYRWHYYQWRSASFDAAFVRKLNADEWVPDPAGDLQSPELVLFETLGWKANPFLQSKIHFKPPVIETLAREAGFEPGVLDLLKKLGVTTVAELRKLGIQEPEGEPEGTVASPSDAEIAAKGILGGDTPCPTPPVPAPTDEYSHGAGAGGGQGTGGGAGGTGAHGGSAGLKGDHAVKRSPGSAGGRPFISYVATHPDEEEPDPDGLDHTARIALEEKAINLILRDEPQLHRTPTRNPGFDLFEAGGDGQPSRWIEVKAMTGDLHSRPVGLSRAQFDCAREHGERFWLYVVEHAENESARVVRVQDPAGKARTFTFDHGWLSIADMKMAEAERKD